MHTHNHNSDNSKNSIKRIKIAFLLNFVFAIGELFGGLYINSVSILADSLHDLGDSISLGLSWYFERLAQREDNGKFSYGFKRFSLLGAVINAVILLIGSILVLREAIIRLFTPAETSASGMIIFAFFGILINGIAAFSMRKGETMNAKMVTWHLFEDVLGWAAVLVVSIVMIFTDLMVLDPILSIALSLFVIYNVFKNLVETISLFLQAVPSNVNVNEIETRIKILKYVKDIHHTHVWSLDGQHSVITTHVVLDEKAKSQNIRNIKREMRSIAEEYNFEHSTIEFEYFDEDCSIC